MTKENLIWLTKEIYRLTLLFPKKEPLRYKMRELADDTLADLILIFRENASNKKDMAMEDLPGCLEILDSFFEVVKEQNWVSISDILAIQKEYANLREELERRKLENSLAQATLPLISINASVQGTPAETALPEPKNNFVLLSNEKMNERQEKIMAFLREQGRAQVWQAKQILPEVTKRTLRRDFDCLLKKGAIERGGERNNTFYQIKIVQA